MAMKTLLFFSLACAGALTSAPAQSFRVEPIAIASGGGTSTGGQFSVLGTAGQAQAGRSAGGRFAVDHGFPALITALQTPGAPYLQLTRNGSLITLSWDASDPAFVLENTGTLTGVHTWQALGLTPLLQNGVNSVTISLALAPGTQFFRLRKP